MKKIGIFGSSFNPIHIGHLIISEKARIKVNLDKVLFIPTANPYHKKVDLLDYKDRFNMTKLAIKDNKYFEISDIEKNFKDNSYSYDVINKLIELDKLNNRDDDSDIINDYYFIIGSDSLINLDTWYRYKDFINLVNLVVFKRPSYDIDKNLLKKYRDLTDKKIIYINDTQIEISSTELRGYIKENIFPKYLLKDDTIEYIMENKLWH